MTLTTGPIESGALRGIKWSNACLATARGVRDSLVGRVGGAIMLILIVGDPFDGDGMLYIGPFESPDDATAYAERQCSGESWRVANLEPVAE